MDQPTLHRWIVETFEGVATQEAHGYTFYFFGEDRKLPFVTIAHNQNAFEKVSDLDRPGVYRFNIGVRPETYRALCGPQPPKAGDAGVVETGHDFTALDQLMPHPHYATQSWVCVLSPTDETFARIQPLVREAYELAVGRERKRRSEPDDD